MIQLVFKQFFRSASVKMGLIVILIAVLVSLVVGKQFQKRLDNSIRETAAYQQEHLQRNIEYHQTDIGLLLYYARFSLINQMPPIAALAIGQRDVNPVIQSVTIRAVEGQKYDSELNNPYSLHAGNIDFSFVLIALFPLLIIVFSYNLLSEQQESGTWKMAAIHIRSSLKYILGMLAVRLLPVLGIVLASLFSASLMLKIPFDSRFLVFTGLAVLYILVWFSICFMVISLQRSSNFNAVALLSVWLLMVLVIPALINNFLINRFPVPEAFATAVKQRNGYHNKWDEDRTVTMEKFYAEYPQFRKYPLPDKPFSWLWYFAMQQAGDAEAATDAHKLQQTLHMRDQAAQTISYFIPSLHVQHQMNHLAQSDLSNHLQFLDSTSKFHEKMRLHFYPKIFEDAEVDKLNWKSYKPENFTQQEPANFTRIFLPIVVMFCFFFLIGCINILRSM